MTYYPKKFSIIITAALILFCYASTALSAVTPSQVLVLYNADWKTDEFLTDPGQDSKEIADHYVYMHTDSKTGEKPYILGLRCVHLAKHLGDSHLNSHHLSEKSSDNDSGVIFKSKNPLKSKSNEDMRDSRALEFTLPRKNKTEWQFNTLRISLFQNGKEAVVLVEDGISRQKGHLAVRKDGMWNFRANGRSFLTGSFTAKASCLDASGKMHEWEAEYTDVLDVSFSRTGLDNERDDRHYLEDIENQVKNFLEDPKNARPDGTLLRDHILFIVICHGLPRTAVAQYGISRGITDIRTNYGAIISLEQRLQLMYYDVNAVMGTLPLPHRFKSPSPFTAFYFRTPQSRPLYGSKANPFAHPQLYDKKKGNLDNLQEPLLFSAETRNGHQNRHLFFVMRIDAKTATQARGLIDRAVYASKYDSLKIGKVFGRTYEKTENRVGKLNRLKIGDWLWKKGYHHLYYSGAGKHLLSFLRLSVNDGFFNQEPVYLPGGISGTVISNNGWRREELIRYLVMGVTMTAGVARVYSGAPHIHSKSWWDDEILYPFLLKGRTLGEVLLMNQAHLGWITTFLGDPLYRVEQGKQKDQIAPIFDPSSDVDYKILTNQEKGQELWIRIHLRNTPLNPETSQLRVDIGNGKKIRCQTFDASPKLLVGNPIDVCGRTVKAEFLDPFGNINKSEILLKCSDNNKK